MTALQAALLADAKDMWQRGFDVPLMLAARMAKSGLDIVALKDRYFKETN